MIRRLFAWGLFICFVSVGPAATAADGEFRCDSEVFVGKEKNPVQQTLTIFTGSLAYDFLLTEPEETTLYDFNRGEVRLLDKARKVRTTILADDLLRFTAAYKTTKAESELFNFARQPSFEETFATDVLMLAAPALSYRVTCTKGSIVGADKRYREFADWSARLNAMRPGNLPPFPRMELNKALAARGVLPSEIERTIVAATLTGKRTEVVRSEHRFNWSLSSPDRRRILDTGDQLTNFTAVTVEEYLELSKEKLAAGKR